MLEINESNFEALVLASEKPVMVDFWTPWCTQCKGLMPIVEKLAAAYGDRVGFGKCNLAENPDIAKTYGLLSVPVFLFFKDGQVMEQLHGAPSVKQMEEPLKRLLASAG